jgi:hypothetical protein
MDIILGLTVIWLTTTCIDNQCAVGWGRGVVGGVGGERPR